jgi:hypothetical protein
VLSFQPVLQVGKQVAFALSEIIVVRRVVKQLPDETVKQCPSASSCMQMRNVMEGHYTRYKHSIYFVLNCPKKFL